MLSAATTYTTTATGHSSTTTAVGPRVVGSLDYESLPEDLPTTTTATTTATTATAGAATTTTTSGEATNGDNVMAHVDGDDKDVDEKSEQEQVQVLTRRVSCSSPERPLTSAFTIPKS